MMDDAQKAAAIAAGESIAQTAAATLGPVPMLAVSSAIALLNAVTTKGNAMTMDDFNAAVAADAAASADDKVAQAEAAAKAGTKLP